MRRDAQLTHDSDPAEHRSAEIHLSSAASVGISNKLLF